MNTKEQNASAHPQQAESELLLEQLHIVQEELERTALAGKEKEAEHAKALKAEQAAYQKLAGQQATLQKQLEFLKSTEQEQREENQLLLEQLHIVQDEVERTLLAGKEQQKQLEVLKTTVQEQQERYDLENQQHAQEQNLLQRRLTKLRDIIEQQERKQNTYNAHLAERQNQLLALEEKQQSREREHALALSAANQKLAVARLGSKTQASRSLKRDIELVNESSLFDRAWYLATYHDVAEAGIDPVEHYLNAGASEGRNPGPHFDTVGYVTMYADVIESGLNPLVHYIRFGRSEQRWPKPGNRLLPSSEHHAQGGD